MTSTAASAHDPSDGPDQEPAPSAPWFHDHVLGVEHHRAAWRPIQRRTGPESLADILPCRHARTRRLPRPGTGRRTHRPLWRSGDVHGAHPGLGNPRAAGRLRGIAQVVPATAGVRLLPRRGRHDLRRRHPVRQRLVRTSTAGLRDRRLRRWHGRHRTCRPSSLHGWCGPSATFRHICSLR